MKIQIDIITGFLDSGKTTFINGMLKNDAMSNGKIVILQYEAGDIELDTEETNDKKIIINKPDKDRDINSQYINAIIEKHRPDRIIIEYNGMELLDTLFQALEEKSVRKKCVCNSVINIIDVNTFDIYMNNIGSVFIEQISNSDLIVLNKIKESASDRINSIKKTVKALNRSAQIIKEAYYDNQEKLNSIKKRTFKSDVVVKKKKLEDSLLYIFFGLSALYLLYTVLNLFNLRTTAISGLQTLNTFFLSILMQAIPFILIGVIASSVLQVAVPSETLVKFFPQKKGIGFVTAIFAGVFFPVCDCAIVPVAARLIKKGVSLPVAVTFMLSAPLVNPVVIASTLYAFPNQPSIALYRIYLGVLIALIVGITFTFFAEKKSILTKNLDNIICDCEYCSTTEKSSMGILEKIKLVFMHASSEFFQVGKFLIIGAFISSLFQTCIPKDVFNNLWGHEILSLLVMMLAAFIFSICSTSDAFIAKAFSSQFSTGSIMGFLVLGPMIDIKNMLMLSSSFRKGFVIKLIAIIFTVTFFVLYVHTFLIR